MFKSSAAASPSPSSPSAAAAASPSGKPLSPAHVDQYANHRGLVYELCTMKEGNEQERRDGRVTLNGGKTGRRKKKTKKKNSGG